MSYREESVEAKFGRWGEETVEKILLAHGAKFVIRTHECDGRAGLMKRAFIQDIQPDRLVGGDREKLVWVEIKTKTRIPKMQKANSWRCGFEQDKWFAYLEVASVTKIPLFIAFLIFNDNMVYLGQAKDLALHALFEDVKVKGKAIPFVLWDVDSTPFWKVKNRFGDPPTITPPKCVDWPWEHDAKDGRSAKQIDDEKKARNAKQGSLF